ncbi:nuclear transport factor 2 family protein [Kribbella sp. NPDC051952]|uniref:nuclear transport factor 2 family protein n=1 Tax=Kribbella sp. NPDC051952 TaxID=3154851 RepID=UPI00341F04D8
MTNAQQFLQRFTQAWSEPTPASLSELFTADATLHRPNLPQPIRGRDAIRAYFEQVLRARPDLKLEPLMTATGPDVAFVHWRLQATADDVLVEWEGIDRFTLQGDLAVDGLAHFDPAAIRPVAVS